MVREFTVATLIILGGSGIIAQAAEHQDVLLSNTRSADLQIDDSEIGLSVGYPGASFSQNCGVEIRADEYNGHKSIEEFYKAIQIVNRFDQGNHIKVLNGKTIALDFSVLDGAYGVWFTVKTKDGSTLKETIKKTLGENRTVIAVTTTCQ